MMDLALRQLDISRRAVGALLALSGAGSRETPYRIAAEIAGAKLRAYQPEGAGRGVPILIVPAPFKRPYVWDLLPAVSVVRQWRDQNLPVYLIEWSEPSGGESDHGLPDFADRIPLSAIKVIAADIGRKEVLLAGHSLGGTFAAICAALHPRNVAGLLLVEAPLSFDDGGPLARAVAAGPPCQAVLQVVGSPVPGSALNLMSAIAAPEAFCWHPILDVFLAAGDVDALAIHAVARRWTLDEFAMPGRLFKEVVEWLYIQDRLIAGDLTLSSQRVDLRHIHTPVLAVINPRGRVVPARSALEGLALTRGLTTILEYGGEAGTVLEHIGALIGPRAHAQLWPRIMEWTRAIA